MKKIVMICGLLLTVLSCKKGDKPVDPVPVDPKVVPAKALLSFPTQNETCTTGSIVSATKSKITFKWATAANATSYDLVYKDLITQQVTSLNTTNTALEVTLDRNIPYSWYIVSKSTATTDVAQSEVWKFYNAGAGTVSYAPFPAEIVAPIIGAQVTAVGGKIKLDWNGTDVDNDIVNYDIYFGTATQPILFKSNVVTSELLDVPVVSGTTYYWKIITRDTNNQTSESGISQFKVN